MLHLICQSKASSLSQSAWKCRGPPARKQAWYRTASSQHFIRSRTQPAQSTPQTLNQFRGCEWEYSGHTHRPQSGQGTVGFDLGFCPISLPRTLATSGSSPSGFPWSWFGFPRTDVWVRCWAIRLDYKGSLCGRTWSIRICWIKSSNFSSKLLCVAPCLCWPWRDCSNYSITLVCCSQLERW